MPINPAVISGAFGLGSNILTNIGAKKRESNARFFNMQMERDRRNYDQRMWSKVTKYNHPLQQMARLAEAGLNPNLIYGSSPGSAVGNAQSIASGKQVTGQAPAYQIDNAMVPFMNAKVSQAQANNLNTQAMKNVAGANLSDSQTKRINELLAGDIKLQGAQIEKTEQEALQSKLTSKAMSDSKTGIAVKYATETKNLLANNEILRAQTEVQKLNKFLAQNGIRPGDPLWFRFFGVAFNKGVEVTDKVKKEIIELYNELKQINR